MTYKEIISFQMRLDHLFERFKDLSEDPELLAHWSRYLCVLVSGYLEESIQTIYREYSRSKSAPNVANYVESRLKGFQNPKIGKILGLTASFNKEWEQALENTINDEIKHAVDSIVNIRNKVAHGKDVGITPSRLGHYYKRAKDLVNFLCKQCT